MAAAPSQSFPFKGSDGNTYAGQTIPTDDAGKVPTSRAPCTLATTISPGTPLTFAGRFTLIAVSAQGNVRLKTSGGSVFDLSLTIGLFRFDDVAVVDVVAASTTATCTVTVFS